MLEKKEIRVWFLAAFIIFIGAPFVLSGCTQKSEGKEIILQDYLKVSAGGLDGMYYKDWQYADKQQKISFYYDKNNSFCDQGRKIYNACIKELMNLQLGDKADVAERSEKISARVSLWKYDSEEERNLRDYELICYGTYIEISMDNGKESCYFEFGANTSKVFRQLSIQAEKHEEEDLLNMQAGKLNISQ